MSEFIHPSKEVLGYLLAHGCKIKDIYRMTVKRNESGSGVLTFWQYARNKEGKRFLDPDKHKQVARLLPVTVMVVKLPRCIELDLYGEPLSKYGDDKVKVLDAQ